MTLALDPPVKVSSRDAGNPASGIIESAAATGQAIRKKQAYAQDTRAVMIAMMRIADLVVMVSTAVASYSYRNHELDLPGYYWLIVGLGVLLTANIFSAARVYEFSNLLPPTQQLVRVLVGWLTTLLFLIAVLYLLQPSDDFSRAWMITWALTGICAFVIVRLGFWSWMRRRRIDGSLALRVVVAGADSGAAVVAERLRQSNGPGTEVTAFFPGAGTCETAAQCMDRLLELTRQQQIDEVIMAWRFEPNPCLNAMLRKLREVPIEVKLQPVAPASMARATFPTHDSFPESTLLKRPLAGRDSMLKRSVDIALSVALIVALSPLMLVIAATIAIDSPGPVLFRQRRFGRNLEPILVCKFRTMRHDVPPDPDVRQASRNDARVTRFGRFLRRSSFDELPQLFNVFRGEMSLVGPRPHAIAHDEKYAKIIEAYVARHRVKPGMTGWAQVNGARGETSSADAMKRRIEYDLYYIDNWSVMFDVQILLRTLLCVLTDPNAY